LLCKEYLLRLAPAQHVFTTAPIRNYQDTLEKSIKVEELAINDSNQENKDFAMTKYYVFALYYLDSIWQSLSCAQPTALDKRAITTDRLRLLSTEEINKHNN
jgi:hypothetical protein